MVTAPRPQATARSLQLPPLCTWPLPGPGPCPCPEESLHQESLLNQGRLVKNTAMGGLKTVSQALRLVFPEEAETNLTLSPISFFLE